MYLPIMLFTSWSQREREVSVEPGPNVKERLAVERAVQRARKNPKSRSTKTRTTTYTTSGGEKRTLKKTEHRTVSHGGKKHPVPKGMTTSQVKKHLKHEARLEKENKKIKAGTHKRVGGRIRKVK